MLQSVFLTIEFLVDEEQFALEGIPENMQARVERCEDTLSCLEYAETSVDEVIRQLEAAVDH